MLSILTAFILHCPIDSPLSGKYTLIREHCDDSKADHKDTCSHIGHNSPHFFITRIHIQSN